MRLTAIALACAGLSLALLRPAPAEEASLLLDGERAPAGAHARRLDLEVDPARPWSGRGSLRLTPRRGEGAIALTIPIPAGAALDRRALVGRFRAVNEGPVALRWLFLDQDGRTLFVRPATWSGGPVWSELEWPLALWRWGERPGRWEEVRQLRLALEGEVPARLWIDDLRLASAERGEVPWLTSEQLEALVEDGGERVSARLGPVQVSFPGRSLPEPEQALFRRRVEAVAAWLRELRPPDLAPLAPPQPASLFVFREPAQRDDFLRRLGAAYGAAVEPARAPGFTVQDVATSLLDQHGLSRPVHVHEVVHALAARELRVSSGAGPGDWLHEGLAYDVQLVLFPGTVRDRFPRCFAEGVGPQGWAPLEEVFARFPRRAEGGQVASLIAFLRLERPEWLRALVAGLVAGEPVEEALRAVGAEVAALEAAWLAWGRATFPPGSDEAAGLPPPPGWEPLVAR